ncbi:Lrp/AsnC family transcriptional regulator [Calditerricola satsumensis]|uniref:AsnC family transcriptional regulator n=1 Tax=Calditerricola satsumensis TaxID=373054 RepID=A0A8J3BEF6_9BACI|nr:Lrp/AsnC family transcriptional regulator [Calditerricola satsumensis]GGK07838.1 AsnC family transcriptional regulator [Calditerricola satsumensis]
MNYDESEGIWMKFDHIDKQIVDILQREGRITMTELGRRVELTTPAVTERVRRLEENGVIRGFRADVSRAHLGKPMTAFFLLRVHADATEAFIQWAKEAPGVLECHRVSGRADFLLKVAVADIAELERVADRCRPYGQVETHIVTTTVIEGKAMTVPEELVAERSRGKTA